MKASEWIECEKILSASFAEMEYVFAAESVSKSARVLSSRVLNTCRLHEGVMRILNERNQIRENAFSSE
jgi:hypothetical protein